MSVDLASLSLVIDSRPAVEAATALDKMADAATRGEGRVNQIRSAADALIAALNRNTSATESLTAKMLAMEAAGTKASAAVTAVGAAADSATGNVIKFDRAAVTAKAGIDNIASSARNATAAWAALGTMGAATAERLEIARRMASAAAVIAAPTATRVDMAAGWAALGAQGGATADGLAVARGMASATAATNVMTQAANQNARAVGLQRHELTNLSYQINDVATMALMGASSFQIAATQGGQLVQIVQSANGGISGIMQQASNAALSFARSLSPATIALAAIGTGLAAATVAAMAYNSQQRELERTTFVRGRASGATLDTLNEAAEAGAGSGTISRRGARDIVSQLNATGQINPGVYADVAGNMRDLAKVMGVEVPEASEAVTRALSGGIGGFDKLNDELGLGGAALRNQVRDLYDSGRAFEAQRLIVDAYAKRLAEVTGRDGVLTRLGTTLNPGRAGSNAFDIFGQIFGNSTSQADQLTAARTRLSRLEYARDAGIGWSPREFEAATSEVRRLETAMGGAAEKGKQAKNELTSLTLQPLIDSLNPSQRRLEALTAQAESFRQYLTSGGVDQDGVSRRAMDGLLTQARQLKEDMAAGGAAYADALRAARTESGLVGATSFGRGAAGINEDADNKRLQAFRNAGTDTSSEALDKQLRAIEEVRKTQLDTITRTQALEQVQRGGAFARAPADIQQMVLAASQRFPTVAPEILAAIGEKENGFRLSGPTNVKDRFGNPASTAWGYGQITVGAEEDVRKLIPGFDRKDPNQAVMGAAAYLSLRQQWANGDQIKALNGYGTGPGYGIDILRRAGQLGDTSSLALARDQDANTRAVQQANDNLKNITENYGRNAVALEANGRAQEQYRQMVERGVPAATAASIAFDGMQTKIASLGQTARFVQFQRDDIFARDQLGRTQIQQQAFAAARPYAGTELEGRVRDRAYETAQLYEAKTAVTDAMGGFVTDLRRGTDAASAFSSMLGRLADRALNGLTDSLVSGLFSAGSKGGAAAGGLGGIFASIGSLFGFANGGIMTSSGPLPLRAYSAGGIADSPQLALYGEGRMPEAYVPLPDGRRIPVAMQGGGAANSNAGPVSITHAPTYNVTPANGVTPEQLAAVVDENNRQFAASLPGRVRDIQRRYG